MKASELLDEYNSPKMIWNRNKKAPRNSMGCSEYWYYPEYALVNSFKREEIERMSEEEIDRMLHLAQSIADALY